MTRLERKEKELQKLYAMRDLGRSVNDLYLSNVDRDKIARLEKEIAEMKKSRTTSLKDILEEKGEDVKNRFYIGMIRISMLSDAVNEACEEVRTMMKGELNVVDFSLRKEVDELTKLSRKIASFVCGTGSPILEDCIVDDDKFVDCCMRLATKHITSKLKIKTKI